MMRLDATGGRIFSISASSARVVEVTVDFGGGVVRTLGMHRQGDHWTLRLHPGLPCHRYRFRIDGQVVSAEHPDRGTCSEDEAWRAIRPAA